VTQSEDEFGWALVDKPVDHEVAAAEIGVFQPLLSSILLAASLDRGVIDTRKLFVFPPQVTPDTVQNSKPSSGLIVGRTARRLKYDGAGGTQPDMEPES